jgi:hypothetical protein
VSDAVDSDFADAVRDAALGKPKKLNKMLVARALTDAERQMLSGLHDGSLRRRRGSGRDISADEKQKRRFGHQLYRDMRALYPDVRAGETLEKAAAASGVKASELRAWIRNPERFGAQIPPGYRVRDGDNVIVPDPKK